MVLAWGTVRLKVRGAELGLVLVGVVELLDTVVGSVTGVTLLALGGFA